MKKVVSLIFVVLIIFVFGTSLYAQTTDETSDQANEKKEEKTEKKESKKTVSRIGCCGGFSDVSFEGYEEDPLYKKMKEIEKKIQEELKTASSKAKEIKEKYGDTSELTNEQKKEMFKEITEAYSTYYQLSTEFGKIKAELIAKIEKDMAEKYKDDPLYKAMSEAKTKYEQAQKKFNEEIRKLSETYGGKWNEMTEEQIKEYKEKIEELKKPVMEAFTEYEKAKKAFYDSIKKEKTEGDEKE